MTVAYETDAEALDALKPNIVEVANGIIEKVDPMYLMTAKDWNTIHYLISEWDFIFR